MTEEEVTNSEQSPKSWVAIAQEDDLRVLRRVPSRLGLALRGHGGDHLDRPVNASPTIAARVLRIRCRAYFDSGKEVTIQ